MKKTHGLHGLNRGTRRLRLGSSRCSSDFSNSDLDREPFLQGGYDVVVRRTRGSEIRMLLLRPLRWLQAGEFLVLRASHAPVRY